VSLGTSTGSTGAVPKPAVRRFEDAVVGQTFALETKIRDVDIDTFAALSGDYNPLHMDVDAARTRRHRTRVVHGLLLTAALSRLLGMEFPGRDCLLQSVSVDFLQPVYCGDTVSLKAVVSQIQPALRTVVLKVQFLREHETVVRGKVIAKFLEETVPDASR
jgi:acyl dehydratase